MPRFVIGKIPYTLGYILYFDSVNHRNPLKIYKTGVESRIQFCFGGDML